MCDKVLAGCTWAYRFGWQHQAFPAQWLYGLYELTPVNGLFCHRRPCEAFAPHGLDASVAASGLLDFAVRKRCARQSQLSRPSHPCPAFATMADAPLVGQDGEVLFLNIRNCQRFIFDSWA